MSKKSENQQKKYYSIESILKDKKNVNYNIIIGERFKGMKYAISNKFGKLGK